MIHNFFVRLTQPGFGSSNLICNLYKVVCDNEATSIEENKEDRKGAVLELDGPVENYVKQRLFSVTNEKQYQKHINC